MKRRVGTRESRESLSRRALRALLIKHAPQAPRRPSWRAGCATAGLLEGQVARAGLSLCSRDGIQPRMDLFIVRQTSFARLEPSIDDFRPPMSAKLDHQRTQPLPSCSRDDGDDTCCWDCISLIFVFIAETIHGYRLRANTHSMRSVHDRLLCSLIELRGG